MRRLNLVKLWSAHGEKARYLLVGGWNTVFAYTVFSVLFHYFGRQMHPSAIVALMYAISSINAFLCFRYFVFNVRGGAMLQYLRFQAIYGPILLINLIVLPLALRYTDINAYVIQGVFVVVTVTAGYLGNKYFTFRHRQDGPA